MYPCPECLEEFKKEAALNQHVSKVHKPPPPSPPRNQPSPIGSGEPNRATFDDTESPPHANIRSGRFYCHEVECGRGFSTQDFLDTHNKFFHPKKRSKSSPKTPEVATGDNALGTQGKDGQVKLPVGCKSPTPRKPDEKKASTDIATQFHCRICDKPPSVGTEPAATFCGHLFCYKCILSKVTSTSKCPVCNITTLTDSIFKLDISC